MPTFNRYILEIHRIPAQSSGGPKKAVFLQHGVLESSGTWLVNPSKRSLRKYFQNQFEFPGQIFLTHFILNTLFSIFTCR
jgi:hypothetical protein